MWLAAGSERRKVIASIAGELRIAIDMASKYEVGSLGHSAALNRAEHAVSRLPEIIDPTEPLEGVLAAARVRVRRR